ncbi:MAG: SAM-dependent methyltransferase [Candidatus Saccharibacteria bacterium]|nr:SAM-dependent methyltransferase [Candidatus Saccharibacteria bacterium]
MNIASVKNRGYFKIEGAVRAFNFDFKDKVVLDIGSSTGGFTQYALDHGAKKVFAVEKGTNQMKEPLRSNPRIELHEKTDIFDVGIQDSSNRGTPERGSARMSALSPWQTAPWDADDSKSRRATATRPDVELSCIPDIILADVSFISLTKLLKYAKENLSNKNTDFLVMLKPQFEAEEKDLHNGIVKNETIRRDIIKKFENWLKNNNFVVLKKKDNIMHGKHGNTERFYWLKQSK